MGTLNLAIHNIRGLHKHKTELTQFLTENNIDIMALNETLRNRIPKFIKTPAHTYTVTTPTPITDKGVAHLHKNTLQITDLPEIITKTPTKNLNHSILLTTPGASIQFTTIYCPKGNPSKELISAIIDRNPFTIITGDFNIKHENIGYESASPGGNRLMSIMEHNKYTLINDHEPNHINDTSGNQTVKSLIFASNFLTNLMHQFSIAPDNLGSDHNITLASFKINPVQTSIPTKTINLYHLADWEHINQTIQERMQPYQLNHQSSCEDIDKHTEQLSTNIYQIITEEVPTKTIKPQRPGLPKNVRELIKEKKQIRRKYQRTRIHTYKEKYNQLTRQIKKHMQFHHEASWQRLCNDLELTDQQDPSWPKIKRIMGTCNKPTTIPTHHHRPVPNAARQHRRSIHGDSRRNHLSKPTSHQPTRGCTSKLFKP